MKKRILCGFFAVLMIFMLLPIQALAAEKINGAYVGKEFEKVIGTVVGSKSFSYTGTIPDGMKLTGKWAYKHTYGANVLNLTLSGTPTAAGDFSFEVTYKKEDGSVNTKESFNVSVGKEAPFDYIEKIKVEAWPKKLDYYLSDEVDTTGMKVIATVGKLNKNKNVIERFEYDVTSLAWIEPGVVTSDNVEAMNIEVFVSAPAELDGSLVEHTDHFRINIKESDPNAILRIEVYNKPTKLEYTVGETIDTTGMSLRIHKGDGSATDITEGFTVDTEKLTETGTKTVTVTYGKEEEAQFTASFDVTVKEAASSSSSSSSAPESSSSSSSVPESTSSEETSSEEEPVIEEPVDEPVDEPVVEEPIEDPVVEVPEVEEPVDEDENKAGIPFWVWIIIALLVILIGAAVALFLIGRRRLDDEE